MDNFMTEEFKQWPVERKKLNELNPASYNPRIISSSAKAGLNKSIEKYGLVQAIVWNKRTGNIVGGHQRYKVLLDQGETEADVVVVDLNDTDEVALNIALNNPEIQGDFTEKTIEQLDLVSGNLKEQFNQLKLADLREELNNRFNAPPDKVHKVNSTVKKKKNKEVISDDKVIIECPKCNCAFRKSDKKILFRED